jgi:hypothetical protein
MKRAHIIDVLNFDLCDLQKVGQSKTWVSFHVSLLYVPMIKICSGVIALFVFSVLATWWPNQQSDWTKIWYVGYSYQVVHMYKVSGQ